MELPQEIKEVVADTVRNWPKALDSRTLLRELSALAQRVYLLASTEDKK